jgi:hypothetical protein
MEGEYKFLTKNFFKSSIENQINSIYKDRIKKPERVLEFRRAIQDKNSRIIYENLTRHQIMKLVDLGLMDLYLYFD